MEKHVQFVAIILFCFIKCQSSNGSLSVFRTLLNKLGTCDVQVLHDGPDEKVDWFNINVPAKIIYMSRFYWIREESLQIDIFKSRVLSHCKFAIFISKYGISENVIETQLELGDWIEQMSTGHLFYADNHERIHVRGNRVVITFVTTETNRHRIARVYFFAKSYFRITVLFVANENEFQMCAWSTIKWEKMMSNYSSLNENLICLEKKSDTITFFNDIQIISTVPPSWCQLNLEKRSSVLGGSANEEKMKTSIISDRISSHVEKIINDIFLAANETLGMVNICSELFPILVATTSSPTLFSREITFVITENVGYQYLTCYREHYITFDLFITPFKPSLWVTLVTTLTLITLITTGYVYWKKISFVPWLFLLATMFEDGHLPWIARGNLYLRLALGSWCIMSVILTNCYNGIMISELNSPLKATRPSLFKHLLCGRMGASDISKFIQSYSAQRIRHTNYTAVKNRISKYGYDRVAYYMLHLEKLELNYVYLMLGHSLPIHQFSNPIPSNKCFDLISLPQGYVSGYPRHPEFLVYLHHTLRDRLVVAWRSNSVDEKILSIFNLFDPRHSHYPKGFQYSNKNQTLAQLRTSVESELVECRKSVFISKSDLIATEFQFLERHYPTRKFYRGKEILETMPSGWCFYYSGFSKVPKYFNDVVESGIFRRLREEEMYRRRLFRKPVRQAKIEPPVGLGGAILTVFIIRGIACSGACVVFLIEIRYKIYVLIAKILQFICNKVSNSFLKVCVRRVIKCFY